MLAEATMDTMAAIYGRRAVRSFTVTRIEKATIEAPTALHQEPWAFAIIQDKSRLQQYSDRAKELLLSQQQAKSPFRKTQPRALAMLSDPNFNIFYDAGALIIIGCKAHGPFVGR